MTPILPIDTPPVEWHFKGYTLSTDRARLDMGCVLNFLRSSYWAKGLEIGRLQRAVNGSMPVGLYAPDGATAGFFRVTTDYAVFAYVLDFFVLPEHSGKGLGSWMARTIRNHPELAQVDTWLLATLDAQGVYERAGFHPVSSPGFYMSVPPE